MREVAARLARDPRRARRRVIFYYGGGGQGNHLGGAYAARPRGVRRAATSNALAQEKTGESGSTGALRHARGVTPLPISSAPRSRSSSARTRGSPRLPALARAQGDRQGPGRSLIVIDPRRTKTAAMADFHLQVRPGMDASCSRDAGGPRPGELLDPRSWASMRRGERRPPHSSACRSPSTAGAPVSTRIWCARARAGWPGARACRSSRTSASSRRRTRRSTPTSRSCSGLLTGNFGSPGGTNLHSRHRQGGGDLGRRHPRCRSRSSGSSVACCPCNVIPEEILTDDPRPITGIDRRVWAIPRTRWPTRRGCARRWRARLVLVFDISMTETARLADYVLPRHRSSRSGRRASSASSSRRTSSSCGARSFRAARTAPRDRDPRPLRGRSGMIDAADLDAGAPPPSATATSSRACCSGLVAERPELRRLLPGSCTRRSAGRCPTAPPRIPLWRQAHGSRS